MLNIVEHYKNLFFATLRYEFAGGGETAGKGDGVETVKDKDQNGTNIDELVRYYKRISEEGANSSSLNREGMDKLIDELDELRTNTKKELKEYLKRSYTEMLDNGIDIESKEDFENLKKKLDNLGIPFTVHKEVTDALAKGKPFAVNGKEKDGKWILKTEWAIFGWNNNYATGHEQGGLAIDRAIRKDLLEEYKTLQVEPHEIFDNGVAPKLIENPDKVRTKILAKSREAILNYNAALKVEKFTQEKDTFLQSILPTLSTETSVDEQFLGIKTKVDTLNTELKKLGLKEVGISDIEAAVNKRKEQIKAIAELNNKKSLLEQELAKVDFSELTTVDAVEDLARSYEPKITDLNNELKVAGQKEVSTESYLEKYLDRLKEIDAAENQAITEANEQTEKKKFSEAKEFYQRVKPTEGEMKQIQNALLKREYKLPKFGDDGGFGKETYDALVAFQRDNKLEDDGKAWDETLLVLVGETGKEFYKGEAKGNKEAKKEKKNEVLNITELKKLKRTLSNKDLIVVDGEYFFKPKGEIKNLDAFKKELAKETGKESLSLEEVIAQIQKTPGIELAIDGWLFNGKLNEAEKLTLVLDVLDLDTNVKIIDVNTGKLSEKSFKPNAFPILDIPGNNFEDGVYTKAKFEKSLIRALNNEITEFTKEKGVDLDKKTQKELTNRVNNTLKKWKIDINTFSASDIVTKKAFWSDTAKITDLVKEKNVFENLNVAETIEMKGGLFVGVPKISDKKVYKLINGEEVAVLSGRKLKDLFAENEKYEKATIEDDDRDFKYSKEQNQKDAEAENKKEKARDEKEQKEKDKIDKIIKEIESQTFTTKNFFGNEVKSAELRWLRQFPVGDVDEGKISLNDINVDTEKGEITFDFDDAYGNEKKNSELTVKNINIDKFSIKSFRKQVIKHAQEVANRKEEPKKKEEKKKKTSEKNNEK